MTVKMLLRGHGLLALAALSGALMMECSSSSSGTPGPDDAAPDGSEPGDDAVAADTGAGGHDATLGAADAGSDGAESADSTVVEAASPEDASDATALDANNANDASDGGDGGDAAPHVASLWLGGNVSIRDITADNHVIYYDGASQSYYARAVAGTTSTLLYTVPSTLQSYTNIVGNEVFVYGWGNNYTGPLTAWTAGAAAPATLTANALAYLYQTAWASDEASPHIAYLDGTTFGVSNIYGANGDGTGKTLLVANVDTNPSAVSCFPRVTFRGGYAVVAYCALTDAGAVPILQSFAIGNGWAPAVVVKNWIDQYRSNIENLDPSTFPFGIDPDGGLVVAASSTSGNASLQVFPIDGGPGTVLDPSAPLDPTLSFAGTKSNPWLVYYNTDAGVLKQSPPGTPAPKVLVDAGVNYFDAFSRSGKWMLTSSQVHPAAYFLDISAVSTVNPGADQLIATSAQHGNLPVGANGFPNRAFTTDENYALVYTDMVQTNEGGWSFFVRSAQLGSTGAPQLLSTGYATDEDPMAGSKVAVFDNFVDSDGGAGGATVDLHIADPSSAAPPTLVASGIPGNYGLTSDRSTILYTNKTGGIYEYVLP